MSSLRTRYDWKYWPSLGDVLRTLATDAEAAQGPKEAQADSDVVMFPRRSIERFFEILFSSLTYAMSTPAALPDDFNVLDSTLAAIANAALDLEPDDRVRATEVRDFRPDRWRLDAGRF